MEMISMLHDGIYRFKKTEKLEREFEDVFLWEKSPDYSILHDPKWVEKIPGTSEIELGAFSSKYLCAEAITKSFGGSSKAAKYRTDKYVWLWLTYALYDQIVNTHPDGSKKFLRYDNYYPASLSDFEKAARHRIRTAVFLYSKHKEKSDFILSGKLETGGELLEQVTQTAAFSDSGLLRIFRKLYWSEQNKSLKRGHGSKDDLACRGLVGELKQLMVTFALELMSEEEVIDLLDPRFKATWL
jgi:hypothetical protein